MLSNPNYPKGLPLQHLHLGRLLALSMNFQSRCLACLPASLSDMFLHTHIHRLINDQTLNMLGTRLSNFYVCSHSILTIMILFVSMLLIRTLRLNTMN